MSKVVDKSKRLPWICGVSGVAACLLGLLPDSVGQALQYDRERILFGEVWRLFTGHFVHWNTSHLIWDVAVFFGCGIFLEWLRKSLSIVILFVGPVAISGVLLLLQPDMQYYRGLSAVDMAFFTAICLQAMSYCRLRNKSTLLVVWGFALVMSISKPLLEAILGSTIFVSQFGDGIEASPLSHLFGVLLAVAVFKTITFWETAWKWIGCNHSFRNRKLSETSTF